MITVRSLTKQYGTFTAVERISFGEFLGGACANPGWCRRLPSPRIATISSAQNPRPHPQGSRMSHWCELQTFASGFEADIAIARLEAADIPAMRDSNDTVAIVGFGFQGATARGITVRVPEEEFDEARALLADEGVGSPEDA